MDKSALSTWIAAQQSHFVDCLTELVNLNTFTANHEGVAKGMDLITTWANAKNLKVSSVLERHLLIQTDQQSGKRILLIAHMDTVHPPDGNFQKYEVLEDGFVRGPGIGDIKGGLLMGLWALSACPDVNLQMIVSADEEIGSPILREWYLKNGAGADYAIGLEPGFPQGELSATIPMGVVQARKGSGRIRFEIIGKAAHAGGEFESGISAIGALAHRILQIHALTDLPQGITTNVGLIKGGTAANTIADYASAEVDYRFWTQQQADELYSAIEKITHTPVLHNPKLDSGETVGEFKQTVFLPPLEQTTASQILVDTVLAQAQELGQNVVPISRGGGSDANYISGAGVPSICGMGAPASGIHTTNEMIHLPLLFERLALLIQTLDQLSQ